MFGIAYNLSDAALDKVADLLGLPRGWGTTRPKKLPDGTVKEDWYRRKRTIIHNREGAEPIREETADLLSIRNFKVAIKTMPIVISVSNHNGTTFTNFQIFAIADFDNAKHPESAKVPLERYCAELKKNGIDSEHYLVAESGMKGYHVWVFFDGSVATEQVAAFQAKILSACGFHFHEKTAWIYTPPGFDPAIPLKQQDYTVIETLTALSEGNMLKALFSMHPKNHERFEMPYTLEKVLARRTTDPQTDEDFAEAERIIANVKKVDHGIILSLANVECASSEPPADRKFFKKLEEKKVTKFKTPPKSPEMDARADEMEARIKIVPCLNKCYETSINQDGVYQLRGNLVMALGNMKDDGVNYKYSREDIAYFIREKINDAADNANVGMLEYQVGYWHQNMYSGRCDYFQEVNSKKFCCDVPCGRRSPSQLEAEKGHLHLTRVASFSPIYQKCEEIIDSGQKLVMCPKTTRAGFTTALNIVAREKGKRILFLVPRTSISEKTFRDTICLANEKKGIIINGFVLSANEKACLIRMQEAEKYREDNGTDMEPNIPIPREDCKGCRFEGTIVTPPPNTPLFESDTKTNSCMLETYRRNRKDYDSGFTTYSKIYAILNTPSEDAVDLRKDLEDYDIIVFDEITQFIESSPQTVEMVIKWREPETTRRPDYQFIAHLNKDLESLQANEGMPNTEEEIHDYINTFIENFHDPDSYNHNDRISSPLTTEERADLKRDTIRYLNCLYNHYLETGKPVRTLFDVLSLLCEESWIAQKMSTMEHTSEVNFIVPPKNKEVVEWALERKAQIVITDAVLPHKKLRDFVFGPELTEIPIGDPQGTAQTQLLISDSRAITPHDLFSDENADRLKDYITAIIKLHGPDKFLVASTNKINSEKFKAMFPQVPAENITYYRSNMTIGVACNHRIMVTLSTPYAPDKSYDWAAKNILPKDASDKECDRLSEGIHELNAKNTFFQTIGRVKEPDPSVGLLSIVYCYGVKVQKIDELLEGCQGKPNVIEVPTMRNCPEVHTIVGNYWLSTKRCDMSPNEIKVLALHQKGKDILEIAKDIGVDKDFVEHAIARFFEE